MSEQPPSTHHTSTLKRTAVTASRWTAAIVVKALLTHLWDWLSKQ